MTRPTIDPALLASITDAVPSRLLRKLDKKPDLAEAWTWTRDDDRTTVASDKDAVVTLAGPVIREPDDLVCTCLLAPKCLHRLAVATRLELTDVDVESKPDDHGATDDLPAEAHDLLAPLPVSVPERRAARRAAAALAALSLEGVRGAGAVVQAELLRALHECRAVGLHRLASLTLLVLQQVRARREGGGPRVEQLVTVVSEGLELAWRILDAPEVGGLERGLARRRYEATPPQTLWGIACRPLWTRTGYSGVLSWLVDKRGEIVSVQSVEPSSGRGGRAALAAFANVSLSHAALSRSAVVVQNGTRSFDRRLGGGAKLAAAVTGESSLFAEPLASRFARPLEEQVAEAWTREDRPRLLREAGWDLLFLDLEVLGVSGDDDAGNAAELFLRAGERVVRAVLPGDATPPYRLGFAALGRAPGARLRAVARLATGRERALELVSLAVPGFPRWDLGFDEQQLAGIETKRIELLDLLEAAQARDDDVEPIDAAPLAPIAVETTRPPWIGLERVVVQGLEGGWRALPAAREQELRQEQARLRGLGLTRGADLLEALREGALPAGRHWSGRLEAPPPERFAAPLVAGALYLAELRRIQRRTSW